MNYLYLELNESAERTDEFRTILRKHSIGLKKSVEFLSRALQLMTRGKCGNMSKAGGVVFLLARHVAEEIDAASVLVEMGCVQPCKSHLRSAFEAELGLIYVLESKSEERAAAYLIKHTYDRLEVYDKMDPNCDKGKELRSRSSSDAMANDVLATTMEVDFGALRQPLLCALENPPYDSINAEWKRLKKQSHRHPAWYSLFDGPKSIRDLAQRLNRTFWYEFLYSEWSGHLHAGNAVRNVGVDIDDPTGEMKCFKPLRHPEGLKDVMAFGQGIALNVAVVIRDRYLSQIGKDDLMKFYMSEIIPINSELGRLVIKADWR